jgi:hypothetical protein
LLSPHLAEEATVDRNLYCVFHEGGKELVLDWDEVNLETFDIKRVFFDIDLICA